MNKPEKQDRRLGSTAPFSSSKGQTSWAELQPLWWGLTQCDFTGTACDWLIAKGEKA